MRETANLKLTQFDGSDVPNWLDQYNSDNLKIDTAIGEQVIKNTEFSNTNENLQTQITNNRNQIVENTQDIANTKKDVADIKKGSSTSLDDIDKKFVVTDSQIAGLKTQVGSADFSNVGASVTEVIGNTPINGNNTISGDLHSIHNTIDSIDDQNDRIVKLETSVGSNPISKIAENITSAIGNVALKIGNSLSDGLNSLYNKTLTNETNIGVINEQLLTIGTSFAETKEVSIVSSKETQVDLIRANNNQEGHYFAVAKITFTALNSGYLNVEIIRNRETHLVSLAHTSCNPVKGYPTIFSMTTIPFDIKSNDLYYAKVYHTGDNTPQVNINVVFIRITK